MTIDGAAVAGASNIGENLALPGRACFSYCTRKYCFLVDYFVHYFDKSSPRHDEYIDNCRIHPNTEKALKSGALKNPKKQIF